MTLFRSILTVLLAVCLMGCDALPGVAPSSAQLVRTQDENWEVYQVKVTSRITRALGSARDPIFPKAFRTQTYTPNVTLRPGDIIGITVYEQPGSTLFGSTVPALITGTPGQAAPQASTLPLQVIEPDGALTIPYVGRVRVAGSTPSQAAASIQRGLESQTVNPQVVVSLVSNASNTVSVAGEVNRAGLMPLTLRGERLLDVVAWGGGPRFTSVQMDVRLMRGREVFSVPLQEIMSNPDDNIVVKPNDNIVLVHNPKTFIVMGTALRVNQYPFEVENVSLAEAIAKAGGGIETTTNLAAIFLFRYEPGSVARTVLTVDPQAVDARYVTPRVGSLDGDARVPIMYRVDMTQADGYFFAQQLRLRDKDVVLMATAEAAQFLKVMTIVRAITGTYYDLTRSTNN
ncbi:MAG: polysaccharide export protein [Enhydrobacter sp.]|nr:polysaccharide export protein [Enhydrobacter sp.]